MMKTAIIYYSKHHGNTKKILDAIKSIDDSIVLIDVTKKEEMDLNQFDRIGLASGIYFGKVAKELVEYTDKNLPENKDVFFIVTLGSPLFAGSLGTIKKLTKKKRCKIIGKFHCRGYDTYVFKKRGGIAKGHPNSKDIARATKFYKELK